MNLLEIAESAGVTGFLHCNEFHMLIELAAGKDVLEIGSFMGLSAYGMAWTAKSVLCVDTFKANSAGQTQMPQHTTLAAFDAAVGRFNNVRRFIGTSEEADKAMTAVNPGAFDLIFLDAMHTYEDVKLDIERWWPRVRPGGIMAFHDYGHHDFPGVKQAVDEVFKKPLEHAVVTLGWLTKQ